MLYGAPMDLQQLNDRLEINELLVRYSEALNRADWDAWKNCFTVRAHLDYTTAGGIAGTREDAVAWLAPTLSGFDMRIGRISNVLITFDTADHATVSSQYSMTMRLGAADANPTYIEAAGWYDDTAVRTDDGWRLSARTERIAYMKM